MKKSPRKDIGDGAKTIILNGETFNFYRYQRGNLIAIYRGKNKILRIGQKEKINKQIYKHQLFLDSGFKAPNIIKKGEISSERYYLEELLGDRDIGKQFNLFPKKESILYSDLKNLLLSFLYTQLKNISDMDCLENLKAAIHLEKLKQELPNYSEEIQMKFDDYQEVYKNFPCTLSHGDFHLRNIFSNGVIDFEDVSVLPIGYDFASLLYHKDFFPNGGEYEYNPPFGLNELMQNEVIVLIDDYFVTSNLPSFNEGLEAFKFARSIYMSITHDVGTPRINEFRKDKFISEYL